MTPNEVAVLSYMLKQGTVSDTQLLDQLCISSGILLTIMRSLKTKMLVEQDGRYYRVTQVAEEALRERPARQPFAGCPVW